MPRPVLLAVEDDPEALRAVEAELRERYARDYAVVCEGSSETRAAGARAARGRRRGRGARARRAVADGHDRERAARRVHQLHPHAKRGLLIEWGGWGDPPTGEAIFDAMAHGEIDYYVLRPSWTPDEVFHQAVSSFLLEWSHSQRTAPHTIYVIGESWSGRAYELRDVLERCAIPHAFCLADSDKGRQLLARAGDDAELPAIVLPNGAVLADPSDSEIAAAAGAAVDPERQRLRRGDRRRRPGRPVGRGVRRLGGLQHARGGRGRDRRAGDLELADPQLPRLPARRERRPPVGAGLRAGVGARRELRADAERGRARPRGRPDSA